MPRKKTLRTSELPYHIVSRCNNRDWFKLEMNKVWDISIESLAEANNLHPVNIHAFVLMSNHYHMVIDTPDANIDKFMYEFNKRFSLKVSKQAKRMNRIWGGRYKWSLIKERGHYCNVLKYVYLNPVKANIVSNVETYIYSTLHYHYKDLAFPLKLKPYIDPKNPSFINWIKEGHTQIQNNSMNSGLKKTTFNFAGTRESRRPPKFDSYG